MKPGGIHVLRLTSEPISIVSGTRESKKGLSDQMTTTSAIIASASAHYTTANTSAVHLNIRSIVSGQGQ